MNNLDLIPWREVGLAVLWIVGLAIVLVTLGMGDYEAKESRERFLNVVRRPTYQAAIDGGLALFCAGQMGSNEPWWQTTLWGLLLVWFAASAYVQWRRRFGAPNGDGSAGSDEG